MVLRLVIGFSDGPGASVGIRLLQKLRSLPLETHLVMSAGADAAIAQQTGMAASDVRALATRNYDPRNQAARISSGSYQMCGMVVVACGESTLACIAIGYADTLLHRAADVTMKEARPLILAMHGAPSGAIEQHLRTLADVPKVQLRRLADGLEGDQSAIDAIVSDLLEPFRFDTLLVAAGQ